MIYKSQFEKSNETDVILVSPAKGGAHPGSRPDSGRPRDKLGVARMTVKSKSIRYLLIPSLLYLFFFIILTYPAVYSFTSGFYADTKDGLQNFWNLWWMRRALVDLHVNPYFTQFLHYPYGTTLLPHALNPVNGLAAILLYLLFGWIVTHNIIFLATFVLAGVSTFWLCLKMTGSFPGSLIGGYIYAFSSYHFLHSRGHLEIATIQFVPLYVLVFYNFVKRPTVLKSVLAAVCLLLVFLSSNYYFLYASLISVILFAAIRKEPLKNYLVSGAVFGVIIIATAGIFYLDLFSIINSEGLIGGHTASDYSLNLFDPFLPGSNSRFSQLTNFYWSKLPKDMMDEAGVYLGWPAIILLVIAVVKRKEIRIKEAKVWLCLFCLFLILSYGTKLHLAGERGILPLPYTFLEMVIPGLKEGGVPARMISVSVLALSVIGAGAAGYIFKKPKRRILLFLLLTFMFFDTLPGPIPVTRIEVPEYVYLLKNAPTGGFLDTVSPYQYQLYYQTIHGQPLALGYLSRLPNSVSMKGKRLVDLVESGDWNKICREYKIRYVLAKEENISLNVRLGIKKLAESTDDILYDLSDIKGCK